MSGKINIYSDLWCDIVFQFKNKQYGAYDLRKSSSKRHARAMVVAITLFVIGILSPILIKKLASMREREVDTTVRTLSNIKIDKPKEQDIPKPLAPPPPPVRNTIKYVPPVIAPDDQVAEEDEPVLVENIVKSTTAIGITDVKNGTDDIAAPMPTEDAQIVEVVEPFTMVEQMPEFAGGEKEMNEFIAKNLRYPTLASESGISGMVIVRFVVNKEGRVSGATVLRGIGYGCDEEAVRVVNKMPPWKPGKQGGQNVPVYFTLPIRFVLQQ